MAGARYRSPGEIKAKQMIVRDAATLQSFADWMLPQIAERQKVANNIVPTKFWQYNRLRYRKCSCYNGQTDPDANCIGCYGVGYLPGYAPLGYYSVVTLDISDPGLSFVNIEPRFGSGMNPVPLQLSENALFGYVESPFYGIGQNLGRMSVRFGGSQTGVLFYYSLDGINWTVLHENTDAQLTNATKIKFRAELRRNDAQTPAPFVQVLNVRIQVVEDPLISLDVPRWVTNLTGTDAGLIPILNTFQGYANADAKLEQYSLYVHYDSKRKFRTLGLNPNMPGGVLTSWDIDLALIQPDDPQNRIP
jgi:hypothetical protein